MVRATRTRWGKSHTLIALRCERSLRSNLVPCLILTGMKAIDVSVEYCQHELSRMLNCACQRRFVNVNAELGIQTPRNLQKLNDQCDRPLPRVYLQDRQWTKDTGWCHLDGFAPALISAARRRRAHVVGSGRGARN
jgi:hypothetical protein